MSRQDKYMKYFRVVGNDIKIDKELFKYRKELKADFWTLLKIAGGFASQEEIDAFNRIYDYPQMRHRFMKIRNKCYKVIAERDGEFCKICGSKKRLTVDHVIPLRRGGTNEIENMQILCVSCNSRKGSR